MKSLILLFSLSLALPFSLYSQSLEFTFQKKQSTFGLAIMPVDEHRTVAAFRGLFHSAAILIMLDNSGNVIWEQSIDCDKFDHISDIAMRPDTSFSIIGWADGGDYIPAFGICRIDKMGNYLFDDTTSDIGNPLNYNCAYWTDESLLVSNGEYTTITSGIDIEFDSGLPDEVYDFERIPDLNVVLAGREIGLIGYHYGAGSSGNPDNYTAPAYQIKYGLDSNVVILGETSIEILNDDYQVLNNFSLPDSLTDFKIAADANQVYLTGKLDDFQPYLFLLDDTLGLKSQFPILSKNQIINEIKTQDNQLLVIGDDHLKVPTFEFNIFSSYGHSNRMNAFIKTYDTLGNTQNYGVDVGVTNVESIGEILYSEFDSCYDGGNGMQATADVLLPNTMVEVTNFGIETVQSVAINFRYRRCPNPFHQATRRYFEWTFSDLNLAPNESVILELGEILMERYPLQQDPNLCFWTSVPNQKMDINHDNDEFCRPYLISDTDEESTLTELIEIFPNPVANTLFLKLKQPLTTPATLIIYNGLSQKITTLDIEKGITEIPINVEAFPSGVYFWEINLPKEKVAGRFLKG